MADISKVRMLNGTEYNYKDAKARSDIEGLKADLGDLIGEETDETITEVGYLNFTANATKYAYSGGGGYVVFYIPVTAGTVYTLSFDNAANSNSNVTPIRLVFSTSVPATDVPGTYIEELTVPKRDTLEYTYVPSQNGYLGMAWYKNVYTLFSATSKSGGIDAQVRSLEYSLGDVESTLSTRMDGVEAGSNRAISTVSALGDATETPTGDLYVPLELGNITFASSGPTYGVSDKRVRTVEGMTLKLKAGDTIGLSDYSNAKFWASWFPDGDSTWSSNGGWRTADYEAAVDGEYILIIANSTEIAQESADALGSLLTVKRVESYHKRLIEAVETAPLTPYKMQYVGYITSSDTINGAGSVKKERYTDYIPVTAGETYEITMKAKTGGAEWFSCYTVYDSEKVSLSGRKTQTSPVLTSDGYYTKTVTVTIQTDGAYMRVSFSTYGDAILTVCKKEGLYDIQPVMQKLRKERDEAIDAVYQPDIYRPIYSPVMYDAICKGVNHRGHSSCPENTLVAYQASKANGFYFVETDVRKTSDGVFVLLHDGSINSVARNSDGTTISETVNIADITLAEAQTYDFGIAKGSQFAGTQICTLADFLSYCKKALLHPYIEIKLNDASHIDALLSMIDSYGLRGRVTYISNYMDMLSAVVARDKMARVGYINSNPALTVVDTVEALKTGYNEVFISVETIRDGLIDACVSHKIPLETWAYTASEEQILAKPDYITGYTHNSRHAGKIIYDSVVTE